MVANVLEKPFKLKVTPTPVSRRHEVDFNHLPFGSIFSDHMVVVDYEDGQWLKPEIVPFGSLPMSPSMSALHYGQSIFEGMKAYRNREGHINLFRPRDHLKRLNISAERLCMPPVPEDLFIDSLTDLVRLDADWVPQDPNSSLYIRPIYFGVDDFIGVHPSYRNRLLIFTCPVNAFYKGGVKVMITTDYTRAQEGGVGFVKTSGNYARAMYAGKRAKELGYDVVLWLDAQNRKFVEEFSTMNAFFVIDNYIVTPNLNNRILAGITRDTVIKLLREEGYHVMEREISIEEIQQASQNGWLREAFGTGTAAVISPVQSIHFEADRKQPDIILPEYETWKIAPLVLRLMQKIRNGERADLNNWLMRV